jgi:hypothetical protein
MFVWRFWHQHCIYVDDFVAIVLFLQFSPNIGGDLKVH